MSTVETLPSTISAEFSYLVLGDLCEILKQPDDATNSRWLIAILDLLLTHRPGLEAIVLLTGGTTAESEQEFYAKLERLRDRVAHRKPYLILSNGIRSDLLSVFAVAYRR